MRKKYKTTGSAVLARNHATSGFAEGLLRRRINILFLEHPKSSRGDSTVLCGTFPLTKSPKLEAVGPSYDLIPHVVRRPLRPGALPASKGGGTSRETPWGL